MARQPLRRCHPSPMVLQTTLTARPYHHHPSDCRGLPREHQGGTGGFGDVDGVGGAWSRVGLVFLFRSQENRSCAERAFGPNNRNLHQARAEHATAHCGE